jgi:hypothetical protein
VRLFASSMTRLQNKKKKQETLILNVSMLLRNKCSPRTIRSLSRKLICATTCSFT